MSKKEFLENFFEYGNIEYIPNLDNESIEILHQLCSEDILCEENDLTADCAYYVGLYYQEKDDIDLMKKYYLIAIEDGNLSAMYNLASYYRRKSKYEKMIYYYSMAADGGDSDAMYALASYYHEEEQYEDELKYCTMAARHGSANAMFLLAKLYEKMKLRGKVFECDLMLSYKTSSIWRLNHYCSNPSIVGYIMKMYTTMIQHKETLKMKDFQITKLLNH